MTAANVYQQRPTTGAKAESSLHHADLASLVGKGRKNAGVTVREKKLLGHLTFVVTATMPHSPPACTRPWASNCRALCK